MAVDFIENSAAAARTAAEPLRFKLQTEYDESFAMAPIYEIGPERIRPIECTSFGVAGLAERADLQLTCPGASSATTLIHAHSHQSVLPPRTFVNAYGWPVLNAH